MHANNAATECTSGCASHQQGGQRTQRPAGTPMQRRRLAPSLPALTLTRALALSSLAVSSAMRSVAQENLRWLPAAASGWRCRGGLGSRSWPAHTRVVEVFSGAGAQAAGGNARNASSVAAAAAAHTRPQHPAGRPIRPDPAPSENSCDREPDLKRSSPRKELLRSALYPSSSRPLGSYSPAVRRERQRRRKPTLPSSMRPWSTPHPPLRPQAAGASPQTPPVALFTWTRQLLRLLPEPAALLAEVHSAQLPGDAAAVMHAWDARGGAPPSRAVCLGANNAPLLAVSAAGWQGAVRVPA